MVGRPSSAAAEALAVRRPLAALEPLQVRARPAPLALWERRVGVGGLAGAGADSALRLLITPPFERYPANPVTPKPGGDVSAPHAEVLGLERRPPPQRRVVAAPLQHGAPRMVGERGNVFIRVPFPLSRDLEVVRAGAASNAAGLARVLKIGGLHHAHPLSVESFSNK